MEIRIPMTEVEYCLICKQHIGKGNDPAVCSKQTCRDLFEYECDFNKWAKNVKKEIFDGRFPDDTK